MLAIRSGETYDKSDIGTSKLLADGKYRGWHYTAGIYIGGNPFNYFTWHKAGLALEPGAIHRGSTVCRKWSAVSIFMITNSSPYK